MKLKPMDRRTFLRGAGTMIALPFLEAMIPIRAFGSTPGAPQRFVALYHGNGTRGWNCAGTENNWTLSQNLQLLAPYKADISRIQGLSNDAAIFGSNMDSTTAHWQASTTFLTGQTYDYNNRATRVALYSPGASVDQMIAQATPNAKKSLVMSCHSSGLVGGGGGGSDQRGSSYFLSHVSWQNQTTQSPMFINSATVFNYLFGSGVPQTTNTSALARAAQKKSILDDVLGDIQKLTLKLGAADKQKLDEYLTSVNEVERRIASEANQVQACTVPGSAPYLADVSDVQGYYAHPAVNTRAKNMIDLLTLALQCDITRVSSLILVCEHSYIEDFYFDTGMGIHNAFHEATHGLGQSAQQVVNNINNWSVKQFAYLLNKLKNTPDVSGNLLDNTLLMFGCGQANNFDNDHDITQASLILAGRGSGYSPGRLVQMNGARHSDFLATIAQRFGINAKVGMSQGTLAKI